MSERHRLLPRSWKGRLIGAGVLLLLLAGIGVDLYTRYLPAADALRDGQRAVQQVRDLMNAGASGLDTARLDQIDALLTRAADDFGPKSRVIEAGWLLDIGDRMPWLGDQVKALRSLRSTGAAGARLGSDLVSVLRHMALGTAGAASTLSRLVSIAETQAPLLNRVRTDLDAVDAAAAQIPTTSALIRQLADGRSLAQSLVPRLDAAARPAIALLQTLPAAAGPGQHRYLLLLDNPGEERPGGGFIGAVGEVTVSQGVVTDRVFRSSDFAGDRVTLPPPRGLRETMFQHAWELQDANWSPDFPTSAAVAAHFYQLATGHAVDGVIGVDPIALSYVLGVTGPVRVPPFPQEVTAESTLLTLNEITNKARPGDPGKAYLPPFGAAMLERILTAPLSQDAGIAAALVRGAQEKHIVMSFADPALMAKADAAGYTGRVSDPASDAVQVVDANVGGNKADLVVTRRYALTASVGTDGQVKDTLTLQYQNPVQTEPALASLVSAFDGAYRDYVRVYIPETASLQALMVERDGATAQVSPEGVDFELHRQAIAYLLVVPAGQRVTLTLTYTGPFVDTSSTPMQYTLQWAKEIGAPSWPVAVTVVAGPREREITGDLSTDHSWTVNTG